MIELYKASAGSGKTYNLAMRYISFLISGHEDGSRRRVLRNDAAIRDAVSRILAITFTNKATAEMKERIVDRLADLAGRIQNPAKTAYLKEFMSDFGASEAEVRHAAAVALRELLINYSDFHVSTIDSFFQSVLRTFAYESDLNDSYQVEIDSDWTARVGVDMTLSSINNSKPDTEVIYWLTHLMEKQLSHSGRFDLFQKRESEASSYRSLVKMAMNLESESFKTIRTALDDYFTDAERFKKTYTAYETFFHSKIEAKNQEIVDFVSASVPIIEPLSGPGQLNKNHLGRMQKALAGDFSFKYSADADKEDFFSQASKKAISEADRMAANEVLMKFYSHLKEREAIMNSDEYLLWNQYSPLLPYLGLLQKIRHNAAEFYETNNVVQLSETNSLLRRVIGEDDAPFIYERLGSHLNHFLIDEFQDTSRLQWDLLSPLLRESEARGEDNMIIGDAKQSIYRFRNADPSIIRSTVPSQFPDALARGNVPEENTNYRSRKNIVLFNNTLFHKIARRLDAMPHLHSSFESLYANVAQKYVKEEWPGYVRLILTDAEFKKAASGASRVENDDYPAGYMQVVSVIRDILYRGYRMSDIGILVSKNTQASWMINALMAYNRSLTPEEEDKRLSFISDESLAISSSEAVGIIITTLEMLEKFEMSGRDKSDANAADESESKAETRNNIYSLAASFNFFSMSHPELSPTERIEAFFGVGEFGADASQGRDAREVLMDWVQAGALPALIEAIIGAFVSEELRKRDAAYIAAFQDIVAEQCERYATDAASFLQWWRRKGIKKSLSSPEGMNAISVMTIHKAKGLAFDFVIVPSLDVNLDMTKEKFGSEWRWVKPSLRPLEADGESYSLPEYIPLDMVEMKGLYDKKSGLGQDEYFHLDEYQTYLDAATMDNLNKAYVALTRPVKELYIFSEVSEKGESGKIGDVIKALIEELSVAGDPLHLQPGSVMATEIENVFEVGEPAPGADVEREAERLKAEAREAERLRRIAEGILKPDRVEPEVEERGVTSYPVYLRTRKFAYREDPSTVYDDEDEDPRSEGNQLHRLLEWIRVPEDLDRALTKLRQSGACGREAMEHYRKVLSEALSADFAAEWFAPDVRVLAERSLLMKGNRLLRPDRVIIRDGKAAVIDYKFGRERKAHLRKMKDYLDTLAATGLFSEVEGWLWYVNEKRRIKVT